MPFRLDQSAADFWPQFDVLLASKREAAQDVEPLASEAAREIRDEQLPSGVALRP